MRLIFMGTPDFAVPTLIELAARGHEIAAVYTRAPKPAGRGMDVRHTPVEREARRLALPVYTPKTLEDDDAQKAFRVHNADAAVVVAYGLILPKPILEAPRLGCFNVHASLLPRWRGAAPINAAILHGDSETGVTIMRMDAGLDTGPILSQRALPIGPDETAGQLYERLSLLGAELLIETLPEYLAGRIVPRPQPEAGVTLAPMLKKEEGALDFSLPADALARRVRAFNPWPGAFFEWTGGLVKVHRAHADQGEAPAGGLLVHNSEPAVGTGAGILVLDEVQPAGKKPMTGRAFLAGARGWGNAKPQMHTDTV